MDFDTSFWEDMHGVQTVHFDTYLSRDDMRDLFNGKEISAEVNGHSSHIYPPGNIPTDDDVGHYDDVLVALEEILRLINILEETSPQHLEYINYEKLKNTYDHYKRQQVRYR